MITPDDIERLLADMESDRVERTVSTTNTDKFSQAVCAFANDLPRHGQPGYLFVGVDDHGAPAGISVTDELLRNLAGLRSDGNIQPLPAISVTRHTVSGSQIAVVEVQPSDLPPVRYKGRVWVRVGPTKAMVATDNIVLPLGADMFSMQGMKNLGPTLRNWRDGWQERLRKARSIKFPLPKGEMQPAGYVVMQHGVREGRPVKAYREWVDRMPGTYRKFVLNEQPLSQEEVTVEDDPYCLERNHDSRALKCVVLGVDFLRKSTL